MNFPFGTNGQMENLLFLGVPILKHIRVFPFEKCSCLIPNAACSHVLAVKTALRMTDSPKQFASMNIGLVRTNARGKAKSGRKQPRPGDIKMGDKEENEPMTDHKCRGYHQTTSVRAYIKGDSKKRRM